MAQNTKIQWAHDTGNIWIGCTHVHDGCKNCYAEKLIGRFNPDNPMWGNDQPRRAVKSAFAKILGYQAFAASTNSIRRVFIGSLMDIFEKPFPLVDHKNNPLFIEETVVDTHDKKEKVIRRRKTTEDLRREFFYQVVPACPNLQFLLLTKRPSNINKYIPEAWKTYPPHNVIYGATVVDNKTMWDVMKKFEKVHGRFFLSIEPLLEPLDIFEMLHHYENEEFFVPNWIIVGGESGSGYRPFEAEWARTIQGACQIYDIPFFMKQMNKPVGTTHEQAEKMIPEDLMIRQFPPFRLDGNSRQLSFIS